MKRTSELKNQHTQPISWFDYIRLQLEDWRGEHGEESVDGTILFKRVNAGSGTSSCHRGL